MVSFPPCKINLGLNVIGKRTDGFHDLSTCFYPVPWTDVLEIVPAKDFTFSASGVRIPGPAADNLCVRAYQLLQKDFALKPVSIYLLKNVPVGAGLGGGSSDGAHALKSLNDLFNLSLTGQQLHEYAARLGSDCPFFIENKPQMAGGRGEILSEIHLSLKGKFIIIVTPDVQISTAEAFSGIVPREPSYDLRTVLESHPVEAWRDVVTNDFESHIFSRFPVISALKQKLYAFGAKYASMSGSGSAVYGLFDEQPDLAKEFESVQYWYGRLG